MESKGGGPARPASAAAATIASSISCAGSLASSRPVAWCRVWPTPMMTGVRGSIVTSGTLGCAVRALRIAAVTTIAIGGDHAGYELKTHFIVVLKGQGHEIIEHGTDSSGVTADPPIIHTRARR